MAYQKILIDNTSCSRRFHVTFDDSQKPLDSVNLKCPYCNVTVFSETNHPPAKIARQENLIQTTEISDHIVSECNFQDHFSKK